MEYIRGEIERDRCIICLGEDVRYNFAESLISSKVQSLKEDGDKYTFWIYQDIAFNFFRKTEELINETNKYLLSELIPFRSIVQLPSNNIISKTLMSQDLDVKFYIFEAYPYGKKSTEECLKTCIKEYPGAEIKVILWKQDKVDGEQLEVAINIQRAEERFNNLISNCVITDNDDVYEDLLHMKFEYAVKMGKGYRERLEKLIKVMEEEFDKDYKINVANVLEKEFCSNERLEEYCKYENIKSEPNIWQGYVQNFFKVALISDGRIQDLIINYYKKYIMDICFWEIDEDIKLLRKDIQRYFYNYIVVMPLQSTLVPKTEMEYKMQMTRFTLDYMFKERLQKFFSEGLRICLYNYINEKIAKVQEI